MAAAWWWGSERDRRARGRERTEGRIRAREKRGKEKRESSGPGRVKDQRMGR